MKKSNTEENLSEVAVQIATCAKCAGSIKIAIKDSIDKTTAKEFAKLMSDGCNIILTNVIVARGHEMCRPPCEGMWPKKKKA